MAFANYEELAAGIASWLSRPDLDDVIPDFIRLAELNIQRKLNLRGKDTKATGTFTIGQDFINAPSDLLEPVYLRINSNPLGKVEVVTLEKLADVRQNAGHALPIAMAVVGTTIELAPVPQSATGYTLYYRAGVPALSPVAPTNWLLTAYPDLYLYGALVESAPYLRNDARILLWKGIFDDKFAGVKRQEWRARTGGGPLRIRPDVFA